MSTQERPVKEINVGGHRIFLYEFITMGEKRRITNIFLQDVEFKSVAGAQETSGMRATVASDAEDESIRVLVHKIVKSTGEEITSKDAILSFVLGLPDADGVVVMKEINAITNPKSAETR